MFKTIATTFVRVANSTPLLIGTAFSIWLTCSLAFSVIEKDKTVGDGLWWGVVTGSTVGYGDHFPVSPAGRILGSILILSMLILTAMAISQLSAELIVDRDAFTHEEQEEIARLERENNAMLRRLLAQSEGETAVAECCAQAAAECEAAREAAVPPLVKRLH
jgi:hypothetical protein